MPARSIASGAPMDFSPTRSSSSSFPMIRGSWRSCATWWGSMSIRTAHALVLSSDEKSQIQVLDRSQPGLPLKKGRAGTMTHDYKRNRTTTVFAALDVLEGK